MGNYKQKTHSNSLEGNQGVTECSQNNEGVVYDCYCLVTFQPSFQITLHRFVYVLDVRFILSTNLNLDIQFIGFLIRCQMFVPVVSLLKMN